MWQQWSFDDSVAILLRYSCKLEAHNLPSTATITDIRAETTTTTLTSSDCPGYVYLHTSAPLGRGNGDWGRAAAGNSRLVCVLLASGDAVARGTPPGPGSHRPTSNQMCFYEVTSPSERDG